MAEVAALLAAAEEAEERCRRYSRVADALDKLTLALYIPAFATVATGLAAHMLYGLWQIATAGLALWVAGYVAYILRDVYDLKSVKAARQACVFRHLAEAALEIEKLKEEITKQNGTA
jgi:hypothetical protein